MMRLFKDKDILTRICGNTFMVLKVGPPLTVSEAQLDHCVESIRSVVETVHSSTVFWIDPLNPGRRAMSL
jgi:ornithine--oxo-acid transaminase